jgi:hypothetical protein
MNSEPFCAFLVAIRNNDEMEEEKPKKDWNLLSIDILNSIYTLIFKHLKK